MSVPLSVSQAAEAVSRTLTDLGPVDTTALLQALRRQPEFHGLDAPTVFDELVDSDALSLVYQLPDGRWCELSSLLAGRVVTHRLTADEVEYGFIALFPDCAPALAVMEDAGELLDGTRVQQVYPEHDPLGQFGIPPEVVPADGAQSLPAGFVQREGLVAGDYVAVRIEPAGIRLTRVDGGIEDYPAAAADALRTLLEQHGADGLDAEHAGWALCAEVPDLWTRPIAPFEDLLAQTQSVYYAEQILPPDTNPREWEMQNRIDDVAHLYGLHEDDALAVTALATRYEQVVELVEHIMADDAPSLDDDASALGEDDPATSLDRDADEEPSDGEIMVELARVLADPDLARALLAETLGPQGGTHAMALGAFADSLAERLTSDPDDPHSEQDNNEALAALTWLSAQAAERLGEAEQAEQLLHTAHEHAPSWPPVLADLAHYASDRGHLDEATDLARKAGLAADEPLVQLLRHLRQVPVRDLGRNKPCWCGSGRKYKVCHLGREELPLAERAGWLYQKASAYLQRGTGRALMLTLAVERSEHYPGGLLAALQDPVVADVALAEGKVFEDFLRDRGALLPDDERLLAGQWALSERTVWEVEDVRPARGLRLRDVRTGDRLDVREATASRALTVGMLVCARVLPAGDTWQIFGGLEPVALHERGELIRLLDDADDPVRLVAMLSRRFAPPQLRNTEGEATLIGEIDLRVPDAAEVARVLDRDFARRDQDAVWHEFIDDRRTGGQTVRATLRLSGDRLRIEANSAERLDRVLATLRASIPELEVVADRRAPLDELLAAPTAGTPEDAGPFSSPGAGMDAQVPAELMEQVVAQFEQSWLDEEIPALAGMTPRAAAADPTRRDDLIRLLASFPQQEAPGQMSAERLRAALGLE